MKEYKGYKLKLEKRWDNVRKFVIKKDDVVVDETDWWKYHEDALNDAKKRIGWLLKDYNGGGNE